MNHGATSGALALGAAVLLGGVGWAGPARAGSIAIVERESQASLDLAVTSLAAGDNGGDSGGSTASTGPFAFSNTDDATVSTGAGSASAVGSLVVDDAVSQPTAGSLVVHAERTASVASQIAEGSTSTGAGADAYSRVRVRFDVVGDDVAYTLTGNFDPGADNPDTIFDFGHIQLYRPFTTFKPIDITSAGAVNEAGTLPGGNTYELLIEVFDVTSAGGTKLLQGDASSYDLTFTVVPEPASAALLAGCLGLVLGRRRA